MDKIGFQDSILYRLILVFSSPVQIHTTLVKHNTEQKALAIFSTFNVTTVRNWSNRKQGDSNNSGPVLLTFLRLGERFH